MPDSSDGGILATILLKQGEILTQIAVMDNKLSVIPDHEARLRSLERFRWMLIGVWIVTVAISGYFGYVLKGK